MTTEYGSGDFWLRESYSPCMGSKCRDCDPWKTPFDANGKPTKVTYLLKKVVRVREDGVSGAKVDAYWPAYVAKTKPTLTFVKGRGAADRAFGTAGWVDAGGGGGAKVVPVTPVAEEMER